MSYTEQDVERVAEAMFLAGNPLAGPDDMDYADRAYYGGLARVALDAMERKPVTAEQVEAYCKERGLVVMTRNIADHLTRQAR